MARNHTLVRDSSMFLQGVSTNGILNQSGHDIHGYTNAPTNEGSDQRQNSNLLTIKMYSCIRKQRQFEQERTSKISRAERVRTKLRERIDSSSQTRSCRSGLTFREYLSPNQFLHSNTLKHQESTSAYNEERNLSSVLELKNTVIQNGDIHLSTNSLENRCSTSLKEPQIHQQYKHRFNVVGKSYMQQSSGTNLSRYPTPCTNYTNIHLSKSKCFNFCSLPSANILPRTRISK